MTLLSIAALAVRPTAIPDIAARHAAHAVAKGHRSILACGLLALCTMVFTPLQANSAEIIQIAGPGFSLHCPGTGCSSFSNTTFGEVATANLANGVLENAQGSFYAPVVFPTDGQLVCHFALIYRNDSQGESITARLLKKPFTVGGPALGPAVVMAQVTGNGPSNKVQKASTTAISHNTLTLTSAFYYVELDIPFSDLEVLGVQIVFDTSCQ